MKSVTNVDAVDKERLEQNYEHVPATVSAGVGGEAYNDLMVDAFGALYKYQPLVKDSVSTDRQLNKHVVEEMMSLAEYKQLRNFTVGDAVNAAGSLDMVRKIWNELPDAVKDAQQDTESISAKIDEALESDEYDPSALEGLFEDAHKAEENLEAQVDEWKDDIRIAVRRVLAQAEQDTAATEQAMVGLGWGRESGPQGEPTTADEKLRIARAVKHSKKLQDIMRQAGRMTNIAQKKQRQKVQYTRTEVVGIEQGDDLSAVLPAEFGYLMHGNPALKNLFLKRLSEAELLQYEMETREPQAQGPIIVMVDCSGSMGGEPDTWSKACALALYSIARKQRRDFSFILFDTRITNEVHIAKGEHKPDNLIALLTSGVGGGTSFEAPLRRAVELIKTDAHKKADVVVITDGYCDISDGFKVEYDTTKKELEFSTYTIIIGNGAEEVRIAKKFSDSITTLDHMISSNEGAAFDVVFNI